MSSIKPPKQIPIERWEIFLRMLSERLSKSTEKTLAARCWKPSTLRSEISAVTQANKAELLTTFPPACEVIEHLKKMGWIHPIQVQSPDGFESIEFLLVDMEAGKNDPIYPPELLQAYLPNGVVSYFSAVYYHELTTQICAHHHIARLSPPQVRKNLEAVSVPEPDKKHEPAKRNPLGTEIFRFEDVNYYLNKRDTSLVPGIQFRVVSPRCWLRITTLEQTLLDTLMQPMCCGGEAVVLEAWESGVKQMDADRMADHLAQIQREDLDRRVGAVLEMIGANIAASPLRQRLSDVSDRLVAQNTPDIPLLAGLEFPNWSKNWKVRTP